MKSLEKAGKTKCSWLAKKLNLGRKGILGTAVCAEEGAASGTFWGKKVFFRGGWRGVHAHEFAMTANVLDEFGRKGLSPWAAAWMGHREVNGAGMAGADTMGRSIPPGGPTQSPSPPSTYP